ncbi:MAG TPA: LuxR C-terminal-related transcriptional regulator [Kineosporiaceae bacterium]|nr:LuxR C-terminal-related transcriptional regulator [Kineosporiaceae bacterium]
MAEPEPGPRLVHVAVVDDITFYREWLGQAGTLPAHHHVVARSASAEDMAALLGRLPDGRCDVVVLDLRLSTHPRAAPSSDPGSPGPRQGSDAVELILHAAGEAVAAGQLHHVPAVLVHTQEQEPRVHVAALLAGASGVVHKGESLERLGEAIDVVSNGGLVVAESTATLVQTLAAARKLDLTDTESLVLTLAAHGRTRGQIARTLQATESTVDKHMRSIRDKFAPEPGTGWGDIADEFGLRDLAPARPAAQRRSALRSLAARLARRQEH